MSALAETTLQQTLAADPSRSAFVLANAGAGKTRVLTNRVARLLATGVDPQKILCITFTKSASVEMTVRLFDLLGEWAFFDDDQLQDAFRELEGDEFRSRSSGELGKIRVLFARALETPGGLKIQTIHSFCENVLKRFPLEAGVPPGFTVLEDGEASALIETCIDRLAIVTNSDVDGALRRLSKLMFEPELRGLLRSSLGALLRDGRINTKAKRPSDEQLFQHLGVDPAICGQTLKDELLNSISRSQFERAHDALEKTGGNPKKLAAFTAAYLDSDEQIDRWNALNSLFLVNNGAKPREKLTTQATEKIDPWAGEFLSALQERFWASAKQLRALKIAKDTIALENLTKKLQEIYTAEKANRASLDFDDLIIATLNLFAQADNAWVMYKLDNGIDHVLIDEAQDTSPQQWEIVENLIDDYLAGDGARGANRSFFAVGDLKQSIYAFQGADAKLFQTKEVQLGRRLRNVGDYISATLSMSFRSTRPVLEFVDTLFAPAEAAVGLGDEAIPKHLSNRNDEAGLVEIWPLAPPPERREINPWDAPIDMPGDEHPTKVLSRYVATEIQKWIGREYLPSKGRSIEPGDILILVQTRGALFNEVIRQLANNTIPVAGADRLKLLEDPAIEDMIAFAKFVTYDGDDLSLAEVLKSPLYGFTDADLFEIAYKRGDEFSLWNALGKKRATNKRWSEVYEELSAAKTIGIRKGPFEFFSYLLERGGASGRKRIFERLTESSKDSLDELLRQTLAFERRYPRSLKLFVDWFEKNAGEIKREMESANNAVRVMTVHGAKGLEAPIVILLDAHRRPAAGKNGPLFDLRSSSEHSSKKMNALVARSEFHNDDTAAARDAAKTAMFEEYRRLLYVAATRARDRLYVGGIELGNDKSPREKPIGERSWHSLALDAVESMGEQLQQLPAPAWAKKGEKVLRISSAQSAPINADGKTTKTQNLDIPVWLDKPAPQERLKRQITPSHLADNFEAAENTPADASYSPLEGDIYFRGRIIHRLLELLPELPAKDRAQSARSLLANLAPDLEDGARDAWILEVLNVLNHPTFADVFAEGSRAEVAIAGTPKGAEIFINGQIDRLAISRNKVMAVDYKTNRPPPDHIGEAPQSYIAQMAAYRALLQEIYPDHEISLALLWTFAPQLMMVPENMLDHAFARYVAPG